MSTGVPPAAAAAASKSQSAGSSSTSSKTSSVADRELFWAEKYRNYCLFVNSIADYLPEAQPFANALRCCPLVAFKMRARGYLESAIQAHLVGDSTGRDVAASEAVRSQARENGLDLNQLRAPDLVRVFRYSSLFSILLAEDSQ